MILLIGFCMVMWLLEVLLPSRAGGEVLAILPQLAATLGAGVLSAGGSLINASSAQKINEQQIEYDKAKMAEQNKFNSAEAELARTFSSSEATRQMDFQERMSNSAYQRAVVDMEKAGINPMLAYMQGGASAPSGAAGTGTSASSGSGGGPALNTPKYGDSLTNGLATAIQVLTLDKEFQSKDADIALKAANADAAKAQAANSLASAANTKVLFHALEAEGNYRRKKAGIDEALVDVDAAMDRVGKGVKIGTDILNTTALGSAGKILKKLLSGKPGSSGGLSTPLP